MSLGKRSRPPPMKRTTSVSQIGPALNRSDPESHPMRIVYRHHNPHPTERQMVAEADSALLVDTADFLRACGLCKRRLGPGRDTFIYRGDIAFCSLECREKQIHQDERKEKFLRQIMKPDPSPLSADYEATSKSETVVAA